MELRATPKIVEFLGQNGETDDKGRKALPKYAWPGGYPVYYVTDAFEIACAKHATEIVYGEGFDETVIDADVNWEDNNLMCNDSPAHSIESAYGEDNTDDNLANHPGNFDSYRGNRLVVDGETAR